MSEQLTMEIDWPGRPTVESATRPLPAFTEPKDMAEAEERLRGHLHKILEATYLQGCYYRDLKDRLKTWRAVQKHTGRSVNPHRWVRRVIEYADTCDRHEMLIEDYSLQVLDK